MEIIEILKEDVFRIKAIAELTWPDTFREILSDEQIRYMLDWMYSLETLASQIDNGHHFYMLTENDKDLGFVGIQLNYPFEGNTKIHKIYVLPDAQGKGIGVELIDHVVQFSNINNCKTLTLNVNRFNKAIGFYLKIGFNIMKEENIEIGNGFLMEDYVMEKIIF
jgi:ribosomal protein S18 acetylase RimI-like enzyme